MMRYMFPVDRACCLLNHMVAVAGAIATSITSNGSEMQVATTRSTYRNPDAISTSSAARLLRISESAVLYRARNAGVGRRIGRTLVFSRNDIDQIRRVCRGRPRKDVKK